MATVRKMWRCAEKDCKNEAGKHRSYKKVCLGEKTAPLCKHCQSVMVLSANYSTRITKNGQAFTKSISPRKGDADAHLAACVVARNSGALFPGEEKLIMWASAVTTFERWAKDAVSNSELSEKTAIYYKAGLRPLKELFRNRALQDIEKQELEDFKTSRKRTCSASTVNSSLAAIKRLYTIITDQVKARDYPRLHEAKEDIFKVKLLALKNTPNVILDTYEEMQVLLDQCKTPHLYHFVFGILNTGLRHADILKLKTAEVSLVRNEIKTTVKGSKEVTIPLTEQYGEYLKEWIKKPRAIVGGYLIPSKIDPATCYKSDSNIGFDTACENAALHYESLNKKALAKKFRELTPHHLRHTFATHYLYKTSKDEGLTIAVFKLSQIMGHSTTYITERYLHTLSHLDQASMQSFGAQMFAGRNQAL